MSIDPLRDYHYFRVERCRLRTRGIGDGYALGWTSEAGRELVKNLTWWLAVLGASGAIWVFARLVFAIQLPLILVVFFVGVFAALMNVAIARRRGYRSPSPHQSEGGSSRRWEWKLSGPGSFSVSRVLATVYRSGGVYAIIGIIAGFLLPGICAVLIVMGVGTWTAGDSEGSGSVGAGVFLLLGVVFLAIGIPIFVHRRRFVSRAASAIGVVRDHKSTEGPAGMQSYHPVVQFQTHDGRMVEFESDTGIPEESSNRPGGQVEVLYDPLNPEKAHIKTFFMLWGMPLGFSGVGAVFLVVGVLLVLGL
jgi:hypothetical protein